MCSPILCLRWPSVCLRLTRQLQPPGPSATSTSITTTKEASPQPPTSDRSTETTPATPKPDSPTPIFSHPASGRTATMALDEYYHNKIEAMKLEILKGQAALRRLEAQRNDYNSRVRLLREELGLLQQPGSYVGEVVKVMSTKKILVKVHPEGKYGMFHHPTPP